jgi:RHS repeat-associated protein
LLNDSSPGGTAKLYLADPHGDIVGLVSTAAANQATTSYDPFGQTTTAATGSLLGYQGDLTDAVTKQVDMGTRWYAGSTGRFTSRDTLFGELTAPMSLNTFAYAQMNPVSMTDPTGMRPGSLGDDDDDLKALSQGYSNSQSGGTFNPGAYEDASGNYVYDPPPPPMPPPPTIRALRTLNPRLANYAMTQPAEAAGRMQGVMDAIGQGLDSVGDAFGGGLRAIGDVLTFAANLPVTGNAVVVAVASGGSCEMRSRLQIACFGTAEWADGPRGGITLGNAFLTSDTRRELSANASLNGTTPERIYGHEYQHSRDWALLGPVGTPLAYGADWLRARGDPCKQFFEIRANLADGGYSQC